MSRVSFITYKNGIATKENLKYDSISFMDGFLQVWQRDENGQLHMLEFDLRNSDAYSLRIEEENKDDFYKVE